MNKDFLDIFIRQIENLSKAIDKDDYIVDQYGVHQKSAVLDYYVYAAKDLIKYGEYLIALENILSNLADASIFLDEETVSLARQAFGNNIAKEYILLLEKIAK